MELSSKDIIFDVVNTESNLERIQNSPHRDIGDISVVYKFLISTNESGRMTVPITNEISQKIGVTEEELFEIAYVNTKEISNLQTDIQKCINTAKSEWVMNGFTDADFDKLQADLEGIRGMVNFINMGVVDEKDRLSNNIFGFERSSRVLKPLFNDVPSIMDPGKKPTL